ncbi:MAG: FHA domain-containing protein, partial [Steroidobacteraceae bacterium]
RAYPLGTTPIVIGRALTSAPTSGAATIELPEGLAAVSRRHCTLLREGGELMLIDHSRYGTLVNGERVAGRTRLRTGDTVRLGDPPVELSLIAVGTPAG